jgi:hypothetical protein
MREELLNLIPDDLLNLIWIYISPNIKYKLNKYYFNKYYIYRFYYLHKNNNLSNTNNTNNTNIDYLTNNFNNYLNINATNQKTNIALNKLSGYIQNIKFNYYKYYDFIIKKKIKKNFFLKN